MSIDKEGIENHIDRYFLQRSLPYRYADVVRLMKLKIGKRGIPIKQQLDALEMNSRTTLYQWHRLIKEL